MFRMLLPAVFALLVHAVGCVPPASTPIAEPAPDELEAAKAQLRISATEMLMAFKRGDSDAVVDWMPQPLVAEGTKEKARLQLQVLQTDLKRVGAELDAIRLLETSALVPRGNDVYAVQLYEMTLTGPRLQEGALSGYLVCVSVDRGAHWSFLDGNGLNGDRAKLKAMLLKFPDELELPPRTPPRIKRK